MRLIDAEPIEKAIAEWKERKTNEPLTMTIVENVGTWITHAPTIEAIPIQFLKEWSEQNEYDETKPRTIPLVLSAWEDWRKENESNTIS